MLPWLVLCAVACTGVWAEPCRMHARLLRLGCSKCTPSRSPAWLELRTLHQYPFALPGADVTEV